MRKITNFAIIFFIICSIYVLINKFSFYLPKLIAYVFPPLQLNFNLETISAIFVIFIINILIYYIFNLLKERKSILKNIDEFKELLKDITPENININRQNLLDKTKKIKHGRLWHEFDETFVYLESKGKLYNTVDASYFFNTATLSYTITDNRIITNIPSILTAIGVLGTFFGLTVGLSHISLDTNNSNINQEIISVINGAKLAFITSIWGVFSSLLFNYVEKVIENNLKNKIKDLQDTIDDIFPRIIPEKTLVEIETHSNDSKDVLHGLAEEIGNHFQTAVNDINTNILNTLEPSLKNLTDITSKMSEDIGQNIKDSLKEILEPSLNNIAQVTEDLAQKQATFAEESMRLLVEEFMEAISGAANNQKEIIEKTTEEFNSSLELWTENNSKLTNDLNEMLGGNLLATQAVVDQSKELNNSLLSLESTFTTTTENLKDTSMYLEKTSKTFSIFSEKIEGTVKDFKEIADSISYVAEENLAMVDDMKANIENISKIKVSLEDLFENIQNTSKKLFYDIHDNTNNLFKGFQDIADQLDRNISKLEESIGTANSGYESINEHIDNFINNLNANVQALQNKAQELLNDIYYQVQSQTENRLNVWNERTQEFAQVMVNAVNGLNSAVANLNDYLENSENR